jgi:hypothetical protein
VVTLGSNVGYLPGRAEMHVKYVTTTLGLENLMGLVGYTNQNPMTYMGNAPAGQMLLVDVIGIVPLPIMGMWQVTLVFVRDAGTSGLSPWTCRSDLFMKRVVQVPIIDTSNTDTGKTSTIATLILASNYHIGDLTLGQKDFGTYNAALGWYQT